MGVPKPPTSAIHRASAVTEGGEATPSSETPVVEGYAIANKLGEGGMASVWRAHHIATDRWVALKFLRFSYSDRSRQTARFQREIEIACKLEHPNIARVYDSGLARGDRFFSMQLIDGKALNLYFLETKADIREQLRVFALICHAADYAHNRGIIHRDLKPSNVLVTAAGEPFILDFGLAKSTEMEADVHTLAGDVMGTLHYMAPEQALGKHNDVSARTDVFALGLMLWEVLAGKPPRPSDLPRARLIQMITTEDVASVLRANPHVPSDLNAIVSKATALDPKLRYASAGEFAEDIERHLRGETVLAKPPSWKYFLGRFLQRYRYASTAAAVLILVLFVLGTLWFLQVNTERDRADVNATDARLNRYYNNIAWADAEYRRGDLNKAADLLNSCPDDLRNWEWKFLSASLDESLKTLYTGTVRTSIIHIAVDNQTGDFTLIDASGGLWRGNLKSAAPVQKLRTIPERFIKRVQLSEDGHTIAWTEDQQVIMEDIISAARLSISLEKDAVVESIAFNAKSHSLAIALANGQVIVRNIESGKEERFIYKKALLRVLLFSNAGKVLLLLGPDVDLRDVDSGRAITMPVSTSTWLGAFSGDDEKIVLPQIDNTLVIQSTTGKDLKITPYSRGSDIIKSAAMDWSGSRVACGWQDGRITIWNCQKQKEEMVLSGHRGAVRNIIWLKDGRLLSNGADGSVRLWDPNGPPWRQAVLRSRGVLDRIIISGNGERIVWADESGAIRIYDRGTRSEFVVPGSDQVVARDIVTDFAGDEVAFTDLTNTVHIWSTTLGPIFERLVPACEKIELSPDGTKLAAGSWKAGDNITIWSILPPAKLADMRGSPPFAWSQNSEHLCCLQHDDSPESTRDRSKPDHLKLILWDTKKNRLLCRCDSPMHVEQLEFNPNGTSIAGATNSSRLCLWRVGQNDPVWQAGIPDDRKTLFTMTFSPDGNRLITGGNAIRILDSRSGKSILSFENADECYQTLKVTEDGKYLIGGTWDQVVAWHFP